MDILKKFFLVYVLVFAATFMFKSCSSVPPKPVSGINYMKDIYIKNKDGQGRGMIVLPKKPLYTLEIYSPGKLDLLTFRTCSRELSLEKAGGYFKKNKTTINYRPNEIEQREACPVELAAYDIKGRYAWGHIDFEDDTTSLPAKIVCGKITGTYKGASVCQSREGLIQKIVFPSEVIVRPDPKCEIGKKRGKEFEFRMNKGICVYAFMATKPPHEVHRLTTYGYEKILIRE